MQLNPHLHFNGECQEAFRFYETCLSGEITLMMPHEGTPIADQVPVDWRNKILHATLKVGDEVLTGADVPPSHYRKPEGFSVMLGIKDYTEAKRIFNALAENGSVQIPLQDTFWATGFGMLVDRFRIPWIINCGKPA